MDTGVKVLNKRLSNRIQQYIKRPTEAYSRNARLTQYGKSANVIDHITV